MIHPEYSRHEFARLADYVAAMPAAEFSFTVCTPSPGTADYDAIRSRMWIDNPYDFHDCAHPLVPTALPLREFADRLARQLAAGERTDLRGLGAGARDVEAVTRHRPQEAFGHLAPRGVVGAGDL
ncbi:MAG: hypothetical protein HYU41_27350 [Candidatus Rokubacteria bacterium]|nr:hypothetical protein [Candidatus Rokubacteria bacterium]